MFEAVKESAAGGEDVDEPKAGSCGYRSVAFLVKDEGDDDVVTDGLDVEGHKVTGKKIIGEGRFVFGAVVRIGIAIPVWLQSDFVEGVVVRRRPCLC